MVFYSNAILSWPAILRFSHYSSQFPARKNLLQNENSIFTAEVEVIVSSYVALLRMLLCMITVISNLWLCEPRQRLRWLQSDVESRFAHEFSVQHLLLPDRQQVTRIQEQPLSWVVQSVWSVRLDNFGGDHHYNYCNWTSCKILVSMRCSCKKIWWDMVSLI